MLNDENAAVAAALAAARVVTRATDEDDYYTFDGGADDTTRTAAAMAARMALAARLGAAPTAAAARAREPSTAAAARAREPSTAAAARAGETAPASTAGAGAPTTAATAGETAAGVAGESDRPQAPNATAADGVAGAAGAVGAAVAAGAPAAAGGDEAPRPNSQSTDATTAANPASGSKRTRDKVRKVWGYFEQGTKDYSPTSRTKEVFCLFCVRAKKSRTPINGRADVMATHLATKCNFATRRARLDAAEDDSSSPSRKQRKLNASASSGSGTSTGGPMDSHLTRAWTPSMTREFQDDLLAALLFSSIPFNVLDAPAWRHLFSKWMRGLKALPDRKTMRGPVLRRLLQAVIDAFMKIYFKGAYVTISFDGWKSRAARKLLGLVCTNVGMTDGVVSSDFRGTVDITGVPETAELVKGAVEEEVQKAGAAGEFALPQPTGERLATCPSMVVGLVSDSASSNVLAKKMLASANESLIIVACFPHQLNLMTGGILNHESLAPIVAKMVMVVGWFRNSTKFMGLLEALMVKRLAFVTKGETRWYSHYGMAHRLLELKPALDLFSTKYCDDAALLATKNGGAVIDELRSRRFWSMVRVLCKMLLPIVKEIGMAERRNANLADVASSFGRLHAYFLKLRSETATLAADGSGTLAPPFVLAADPSVRAIIHQLSGATLKILQWRFTRYYNVSELVLAHVLDPERALTGLCTQHGCFAAVDNVVEHFVRLAARFGTLQGEQSAAVTRRAIAALVKYLADGPDSLLLFNPNGTTARIPAVVMWAMCSEFNGTALQQVAQRLLSVCCHAAEMERVWSGMGLANTPARSRLDVARLTSMTRVMLHLRAEHAKDKSAREAFTPGCLMEDEEDIAAADTDGVRSSHARSQAPPDGSTPEVARVNDFDELRETGRSLREELDEELALCSRTGHPTPDELDAQDVDGGGAEREFSDEVAMARYSELLRRCGSQGSTGGPAVPSPSGRGVPGAANGVGDARTAAPVVLLCKVFDSSWYLRDAISKYGVELEA